MMKNEKFDARSQNTLVAIRSSILELLQKKRLQEITIAEVCRFAHINRGTFYHHYFDIYDAYESIEDEFFEEISVRLSSVDVSRLELSFFQEILVSVTMFNQGQASKIFNRLQEEKQIVVLKNNIPTAVLLSPDEYDRLLSLAESEEKKQ